MPIDPREIAPGKCYVTAGEQVRRVLTIRGADVFYEMRTRSMAPGAWGPRRSVSAVNFAATVEREIPIEEVVGAEGSPEEAPPPAPVPTAPPRAPEPAPAPAPPAKPDEVADLIARAHGLLAEALPPIGRAARLERLYAAADILVQAIDAVERDA